MSVHAEQHVNCFECHQSMQGQEVLEHRGFQIAKDLTAANCAQRHATEYEQFLRSRHAAPSWAAAANLHAQGEIVDNFVYGAPSSRRCCSRTSRCSRAWGCGTMPVTPPPRPLRRKARRG